MDLRLTRLLLREFSLSDVPADELTDEDDDSDDESEEDELGALFLLRPLFPLP